MMSKVSSTKLLFTFSIILFIITLIFLGLISNHFFHPKRISSDHPVLVTPEPYEEDNNQGNPTAEECSLVRVRGTVVDENDAGFNNVSIQAESELTNTITYSLSTDTYGRFLLKMEPGSYLFTISSEDAIVSSSRTVQIVSSVSLHFSLPRKNRITGRIVNESGEPIEGAQLSISAIRNPNRLKVEAAAASVSNCTYSTQSGPSGQFDFFPIWPGQYALTAQAPGFLPYEEFDVRTGNEKQIIVLKTKTDLQITVVDNKEEPIFLAVVTLKAISSTGVFIDEQETAQNGECSFKNLLPGTYSLHASHHKYVSTPRSQMEVTLGSRNHYRLYLQRSGHTVSGVVLEEESRKPVPNFYMQLKPESWSMVGAPAIASASSNQQGEFELLLIPEGRY